MAVVSQTLYNFETDFFVASWVLTFLVYYSCYRRIETFLPEQKKLWEESGTPLASLASTEKLKEFEKEQEVHVQYVHV